MRRFFKLQIKNNSTGINHVDEVLKDSRITSDIEFAKEDFENLNKGDVLLIHKGSYPICLVEVLYKIKNKSEIIGTDFGINYKIKILSYFEDLDESLLFKKNNSKVGHSGTFSHLYNNSPTLRFIQQWFQYMQNKENMQNKIDLLEYKKQIILQGPPGTGKTKTAKDLAVEILELEDLKELNNNEQFKLIQFHPSYTYEDFVRGIVSKPNEDGEGVLFKTENKILAEFAEKALKNKLNSQKGATELSKEKWLNEQFEQFVYSVSELLEVEEKIELTDSVVIIEIDEDAFRYKGLKGWTKKGNRMLFKDIKQAYLDENFERQDLIHNQNLSGLAKWHSSYYVRVLDMFKTFLNENHLIFVANTAEKEALKNYVLIIDEINRANLPSVLGELIYALEYRDEAVESMYEYGEKREIILPSNLYIIGTMNTADRSVGHIDYAIKRRFAFVDILPTDQAIDDVVVDPGLNAKAKGLYHKVAALFNEDKSKTVYLQSDFKAKDVQLGHSYFLVETEKQLELKLEFEIKPLLNEYVKDGILNEEALLEIANL